MSFLFFAEQENPTGKLANEETEDFERLGSFSFLLALFFFFHKKKKKAEPMDSADGSSNGYTVGKYTGPVVADGKFKIIRETGNGVKQEIQYDRIKRRPVGLVTKLANEHVESALGYTYDNRNNITEIKNVYNEARTQNFIYDKQNRLEEAKGKYGTETYKYDDNGNMTKRGLFTLAYADANHKHAVTSVTSANTGTFNYSYDESGNMIARNGDTMAYNTQGKLKEIKTTGGDVMEYLYESTGNRIRKRMKNSGVTVYSFDGLYDITRTKELESHTLYFKGLYGDTFAQMTRNDARLASLEVDSEQWAVASMVRARRLKDFVTEYSRHAILSVYGGMIDYRAMLVLATMFILLGYGLLLLNDSMTTLNFPIPLVLACYILLFSSCGNFTSKKKGEAPWLLLANGINDKTPSIDDVPPTGSSAGASASSGATLIAPTGMYFLHPDHLGSVSMITDGNGNVISGGNNGGKSSINYKPYGEVNRTDSSGPDISKFKYTGQEEDKESGLLYYKARYYDPMLGRFLQADSVVMPDESFGMNRYMYVSGSPVNYGDSSGNAKDVSHMFGQMIKHTVVGAVAFAKDMKGGAEWAAKSIKGGGEWASGGLSRAQDKFDHEKFQATGSKYERGPWARQQRRVFGNRQGDINNEFWNNAIYKNKFDPGNAIAAWGGSYLMGLAAVGAVQIAYMTASIAVVGIRNAIFNPNFWMFVSAAGLPGYTLGGTQGFTTGKWDEKKARRAGLHQLCFEAEVFLGSSFGQTAGTPTGGITSPPVEPTISEKLAMMSGWADGAAGMFNNPVGCHASAEKAY